MTGLDDAWVGDEQRAAETLIRVREPNSIRRVPPEDRPCSRMEIERDHREVNFISGPAETLDFPAGPAGLANALLTARPSPPAPQS